MDAIVSGLVNDYGNYELYLTLGDYYKTVNPNQAYLCYENAQFYCENPKDLVYISQCMEELSKTGQIEVFPTSIVIVSYNCKDMMIDCIESIRTNNKQGSYEIVVVDNNSQDGVVQWLKEQEDIRLILNQENKGFGYASNQGAKAARPENNLLFLNNDTIVPSNAIFWLRMGIYEDTAIGAAGSVSNYVGNEQSVAERYDTVQEWLEFAEHNNVFVKNPYENKIWLSGFAMMIKREALDNVGLFDIGYGLGNYEDNDLSVRLQYAGYRMVLCHNSFIFHYGSQSFGRQPALYKEITQRNKSYFIKKWDFDIDYYTYSRNEIIEYITEDREASIKVLEIGCGAGATLNKIQYLYPNAEVYGIELNQQVVDLGKNALNIIQGDVEALLPDYETESFDYIIMADVLEHLYDPQEVLRRFKVYLKSDGYVLSSIPNLMHASVLVPLLKGKFEYKESGILDRTHIRFFTAESVITMFMNAGFKIEKLQYMDGEMEVFQSDKEIVEVLSSLMGRNQHLLQAYQFIIRARNVE